MAGREVKEYTNLSDPKDKKSGKGKIDDEDVTFQRMVAKLVKLCKRLLVNVEAIFMDEAVPISLSLFFCFSFFFCSCVMAIILEFLVALDSDDLLYLKEQMEAEEDAERLLRRTEKRAFAAFKISFLKCSDIMILSTKQQDLLRKVVEVKPKRPKISTPSSPSLSPPVRSDRGPTEAKVHRDKQKEEAMPVLKKPGADRNDGKATESNGQGQNAPKGLLGLAYDSSDEED
ncbi:hypothetical protein AtNW77_Chr1g0074871 [Arabidopsis thaliana]